MIGLINAQVIAKHFKAAILGLEPKEIASLYQERGAILESIREGVIATDTEGTVRLVNRAACRYTGEATEDALIGREACDLLPCPDAKKVLSLGESRFDCEGEIAGQVMIFNMVPTKVEQVFDDTWADGLSAEEVGTLIGASRSTARRYLEHLVSVGLLKADVIYGSLGRPERKYFLNH